MRIWGLIGLLAIFLGGCQGGGGTVREDSRSHQFLNLQGGQLTLHQRLWVEAGRARVFVQDGQVSKSINDYAPQCNFEVDSVAHQGMAIEADVFLIERVQAVMEEVVQLRPLQLASLKLVGMDGEEGVSAYFEGYHFWLSSPKQPHVRRLTCYGAFAEPGDLQPPTLQEIRTVLGDIAHISF